MSKKVLILFLASVLFSIYVSLAHESDIVKAIAYLNVTISYVGYYIVKAIEGE